jgi:hypothetical protein
MFYEYILSIMFIEVKHIFDKYRYEKERKKAISHGVIS